MPIVLEYEDALAVYSRKYPVWDPMLTHDGHQWFMYALTTPQSSGREDFFTKENFIRGFASHDLRNWTDLGTVMPSGIFGKRICAGSVIHQDNRFYFFCSATMEQFGTELLDQRIFLATSDDGASFTVDDAFSLEPDAALYGTAAYYPGTDRMMFAWRDPYVFCDPQSGRYYLFICAGGKRWGTPPSVAVAEADTLQGPYRLLPPAALSSWRDDAGVERIPVWEMERAQVSFRDGRYYMMFSVWEHFMDTDWKRKITRNKGACSQSAIIVLVSDSVTGPYRFDDSARLVRKPADRNLYGAMVVSDPLPGQPEFAVGWYPDTFTLEVSSDIRVDWESEAFLDVSSQQP